MNSCPVKQDKTQFDNKYIVLHFLVLIYFDADRVYNDNYWTGFNEWWLIFLGSCGIEVAFRVWYLKQYTQKTKRVKT